MVSSARTRKSASPGSPRLAESSSWPADFQRTRYRRSNSREYRALLTGPQRALAFYAAGRCTAGVCRRPVLVKTRQTRRPVVDQRAGNQRTLPDIGGKRTVAEPHTGERVRTCADVGVDPLKRIRKAGVQGSNP